MLLSTLMSLESIYELHAEVVSVYAIVVCCTVLDLVASIYLTAPDFTRPACCWGRRICWVLATAARRPNTRVIPKRVRDLKDLLHLVRLLREPAAINLQDHNKVIKYMCVKQPNSLCGHANLLCFMGVAIALPFDAYKCFDLHEN